MMLAAELRLVEQGSAVAVLADQHLQEPSVPLCVEVVEGVRQRERRLCPTLAP